LSFSDALLGCYAGQLLTLETIVRSCPELFRSTRIRSLVKPAKTLHGSRRPMATWLVRTGPGTREGWLGFLPAFYAEPLE
jgi:hypothetical protein